MRHARFGIAVAVLCLGATAALAQTASSTRTARTTTTTQTTSSATEPQPSAPATPTPTAVSSGPFRPISTATRADIVSMLSASGQFTSFLKAAEAANLTGLLKGPGNFTVLAPTDAAFAALPPGELDQLMQKGNFSQLQHLVAYHVINTRIPPEQLKGHAATKVATVAGPQVALDGSAGAIKVDGASVLQEGVPASNGVIYVIDKVLAPH